MWTEDEAWMIFSLLFVFSAHSSLLPCAFPFNRLWLIPLLLLEHIASIKARPAALLTINIACKTNNHMSHPVPSPVLANIREKKEEKDEIETHAKKEIRAIAFAHITSRLDHCQRVAVVILSFPLAPIVSIAAEVCRDGDIISHVPSLSISLPVRSVRMILSN